MSQENKSNLRKREKASTIPTDNENKDSLSKSVHKTNLKTDSNNKSFYFCSFKRLFILLLISICLTLTPIIPFLKFDTPLHANYIKLPIAPKFEGNLEKNNLLQNVVHLAKGKLRGPETILLVNDTIYTGLLNGQLVRVDNDGNVHKIVQIGEETSDICNDFGRDIKSKKECGRPLGLRYKAPNFIYLIDAYHGIFKIYLNNNEKLIILSANDKMFKDKPLVFGNDLDIDDEDNIYFTDSSIIREVNEAIELHTEARPDGRVFCFNEKTKELRLLMDNLIFPNGIQLTPNKDAIIIAENCMARLIKYYLKGSKKGQHEILANLPGFPDNIRISDHNTLLVGFAASRHPSKPVLLELFGEYPLFRTIFGSILNLRFILLKFPKYALAAEYDFNGNALRSWHDPAGKHVEGVSTMTLYKKKLYLGSFYIDYISIIDY